MGRFRFFFQFCLGFGVVAGLGLAGFSLIPRKAPPPGWQTIRPPTDIMLLVERQGAVWCGGRDGLFRVDRASGSLIETIQAPKKLTYVTALLLNETGDTGWVGHGRGVSHFTQSGRGDWQTFDVQSGLPDNQVLALRLTRSGDLWVGTAHGLALKRGDAWKTYTRADGLASEAVSVIFEDSHGRLWFGDTLPDAAGLTLYDGQTWKKITTADGLAHNTVNAILEDTSGRIWFGTGFGTRGGATSFDGAAWTTLQAADGLEPFRVRSLYQDSLGRMWFGSESTGITMLGGSQPRSYNPDNGLAGWEVKAVLEDSQGDLWLGTEMGITRIRKGVW